MIVAWKSLVRVGLMIVDTAGSRKALDGILRPSTLSERLSGINDEYTCRRRASSGDTAPRRLLSSVKY